MCRGRRARILLHLHIQREKIVTQNSRVAGANPTTSPSHHDRCLLHRRPETTHPAAPLLPRQLFRCRRRRPLQRALRKAAKGGTSPRQRHQALVHTQRRGTQRQVTQRAQRAHGKCTQDHSSLNPVMSTSRTPGHVAWRSFRISSMSRVILQAFLMSY
jgi:hypothetical protein